MDTFWLLDSEFAHRLTMTLLHFLWQALVAGLIVRLAATLLRRSAARVRYLVNTTTMLGMAACVPITFAAIALESGEVASTETGRITDGEGNVDSPDSGQLSTSVSLRDSWNGVDEPKRILPPVSAVEQGADQQQVITNDEGAMTFALIHEYAPWVVSAYFVGVVCLLIRLLNGIWGGHQLRASGTEILDSSLIHRVASRARKMGLPSPPSIALCEKISVPVVVGFVKPAILIPASLSAGLSTDQLEAVITHELAHIRRCDPLVNLLQRLIEVLLFFHPVVWFISRQVSRERENACDDMVLEAGWHGASYADALLRMAEFSQHLSERLRGETSSALAATGRSTGEFKQRVLRLLQPECIAPIRLTRSAVGGVALLLAVLLGSLGLANGRPQNPTDAESALADQVPAKSEVDSEGRDAPSTDTTDQAPNAPKSKSSLTGRVVDESGNPIAGAMVIVHDNRNLFKLHHDGLIPTTDADGRFDLGAVEPGYRRVTAFSTDWALHTVSVEFPAVNPIQMTLKKGQRVEFRCIDVNGNPVSGIKFHPEAPRYTPFHLPDDTDRSHKYLYVLDFLSHRYLIGNETNADGIFVWENAPAETLAYQIGGNGYLAQPTNDFGPAGSPHTLVLRKKISVAGTVVDADTGEPVTGFRCFKGHHFKSNPPGTWSWHREPQNDSVSVQDGGRFADKLYALDRVYRFRIEADGYRPALSEILDPVTIRGDSATVRVSLHKRAPARTTILTPEGKPAGAARVGIYQRQSGDFGLNVVNGTPDESQLAVVAETDSLGRVQLEPHAMPWLCFVWHETGYRELKDVEFLSRDAVTLKPWATVRGRYELQQPAIADVAISLKNDALAVLFDSKEPGCMYFGSAVFNEDGVFEFQRCVAGEWDVTVQADDSSNRSRFAPRRQYSLSLAPGQDLALDIGQRGVDVVGRVTLPHGIVMDESRSHVYAARHVETQPRLDQRHSVHWNSRRVFSLTQPLQKDGSFRLSDLEPGEYKLSMSVFATGERMPSYAAEEEITVSSQIGRAHEPLDIGEIVLRHRVQ